MSAGGASIAGARSHAGYEAASRALDVLVAAAALVLLGPLWLAIAVLVRATSPGPALFRASVIGRDGEPLRCASC